MTVSSKQFTLTRRVFGFGASAMAGGLVAGFYPVLQGFADAPSTTFEATESLRGLPSTRIIRRQFE
jgi:hypothetical protein